MKIFFKNINGIMDCFMNFYEKVGNVLEADKIVLFNDVLPKEIEIVNNAKKRGIETIVIEHGFNGVSDYQKDLVCPNGLGGSPLIADKICVWGNHSKKTMLDKGIGKERIFVVGSPVIWEYEYYYSFQDKKIKFNSYQGENTSINENTFSFIDEEKTISPIFEQEFDYLNIDRSKKYIIFFPNHDLNALAIDSNKKVWEQLKCRNDILVKLTKQYRNPFNENPFNLLLGTNIVISPINNNNNRLNKFLLSLASCAISTIPGTVNGLCWTYNVPIISPAIDWGIRNLDGNIFNITTPADYVCDIKNLNKTIDEVLQKDTKFEERNFCANQFMGKNVPGNPRDNIMRVINGRSFL